MRKFFNNMIDKILPKDPFGNFVFIRRLTVSIVGSLTYGRYTIANKLKVEGTEHLKDLRKSNVLFLSNHQTYFADVISMYHIFGSVKWKFKNSINNPIYLLWPRARIYYVAAAETMNDGGIIPKIFSLAGAVTVKRSWRAKGETVQRGVDTDAEDKIGKALDHGWVISFPQGTTSPYAPIRKGTAHLIKKHNPIVIPVEIDGFRRAFDKKGLFFKKRDTELTVKFKTPLHFEENTPIEEIVARVESAIGQKMPDGEWAKPIQEKMLAKEAEKKRKKLEQQMQSMGQRQGVKHQR
ncbi:lysophospholipid acyltransferase family protein [Limibacter armeniacum]|uniref:lysophospholipid acyltransferase family protein n=1 Tax=Limibacter armeniacum TaxID=466084 RepID=UPI002FE57985